MSAADRAFALARPILRTLDPERAHRLTIRALRFLPRGGQLTADPRLRVTLRGRDFPNPLGLAAGFDKNAECVSGLHRLGFGFVEAGTVTPLPQAGNPHPRLFRLEEDRAVINRMGFNNDGHAAFLARLAPGHGITGVNIGANKDSPDRIADYVKGLEVFAPHADYLTINISSPNTPGLRSLQSRNALDELLGRLGDRRRQLAPDVPLFLKIAPDLAERDIEDIAESCLDGGADAIVVSNTTTARPALRSTNATQSGGLSGEPLFAPSTALLARLYLASGGRIPLIGAGGIHDAESAWAKFEAGASLIQLYTALVYSGPRLVGQIIEGLARKLDERGLPSIGAATGIAATRWAHQGLRGT